MSGIYRIRNLVNSKCYIGSTVRRFCQRWGQHRHHLRNNHHPNHHLQNAWNKYGETAFVFEILEECPAELCIEREQFYLDTLLFASTNDDRFDNLGYNRSRSADRHKGIKWSTERRREQSMRSRGINNPRYGKTHTEETKKRMSQSALGCKNHRYGIKASEETRRKMSETSLRLDPSIRSSRSAKLTEEQVLEICYLALKNNNYVEISKKFNIKVAHVHRIKNGIRWSWLTEELRKQYNV